MQNFMYSIHNSDKGVFICTPNPKWIETEFPNCSGLKGICFKVFASKPEQPGFSSSICLEVMCI